MFFERADHLVEESGERRPRARDLGRVDHDAATPQGRQRGDVVAVTQPPVHQAGIQRLRPGLGRALGVDDPHGAGEDVEVGLVEHNEDVGVALVEVPFRLRLVVEPQHRRGCATAEDPAARLEALGEGREPEGSAFLGRRQGVDAETGLGDDAQRPLAADEELGQVRTRGGAGSLALGVHDAAVGQYHFETDDHVLDLPVTGRVLTRPAAGQPAADGGEIHGLRPMAERVTRPDLAERGLEFRAEGAGPDVRP